MSGTAAPIDNKMVGLSVFSSADYYYLRFSLRPHHLQALGKPKKIGIRGSAQDGYMLSPDNKGLKPHQIGVNLSYVISAVSRVGLSTVERRIVWMRPEIERDHLRLPPMPQAWIDAEPGFEPNQQFEEGNRRLLLSGTPGDEPVRIAPGDTVAVKQNGNGQGITAPLPKQIIPASAYTVPENADMALLQEQLGRKLSEAREILRVMQAKTGMKMALDRNLRLVVLLPE